MPGVRDILSDPKNRFAGYRNPLPVNRPSHRIEPGRRSGSDSICVPSAVAGLPTLRDILMEILRINTGLNVETKQAQRIATGSGDRVGCYR